MGYLSDTHISPMVFEGFSLSEEQLHAFMCTGSTKIAASDSLLHEITGLFAAAVGYFAQPLEVKLQDSLTEFNEGFRRQGLEYSCSPERPDLCESFSAHPRLDGKADELASISGKQLHASMLRITSILDRMAARILTLSKNQICKSNFDDCGISTHLGSYLQLNSYGSSCVVGDVLQDPHEDGHLLTITKATAPGLEIETADKDFEEVDIDSEHIFVMAGEILSLMSNGIIRPCVHRVLRKENAAARISLMYFVNPDPLCHLVLHPWICGSVNDQVNIIDHVISNPARFGLATLDKILK